MVWIHGGAFTVGSASSEVYRPEYLMEHDIVLVTTNYRLGALGKLMILLSFKNDLVIHIIRVFFALIKLMYLVIFTGEYKYIPWIITYMLLLLFWPPKRADRTFK